MSVLGNLTHWLFNGSEGFDAAGQPRDPKWRTVRNRFLRDNSTCAACGTEDEIEIHHCVPVHIDKSLELCESNLIALCRDHHLTFGHLMSWFSFNSHVREDARAYRKRIEARP